MNSRRNMPLTLDELPAPVSARSPRPTSRWPSIGTGGYSVPDEARTLSGMQRGGSGVSIASVSSVASSSGVAQQVQNGVRMGFWRRLVAMLASVLQMLVTNLERMIESLGGKLDPEQIPDAVDEYRRSTSSEAQLKRAHCLVRAGDSEKGLCIYISLLEADPDNTSLLDTASELLIQLGYPEYGRHLLAKSIALAPESNPSKYLLLSRTQDAQEALSSLEKALHLLTIQEVDMQHEHGRASAQVKQTRTDISRVFAALAEVFAHDLYMQESAEDKCRKLVAQALEYDPECKEALHIHREMVVWKRGISIQDPLQPHSGCNSSFQDASVPWDPIMSEQDPTTVPASKATTHLQSSSRASRASASPNNSACTLLGASPENSTTREAEEDGVSSASHPVAGTSDEAPKFFVPLPMDCNNILRFMPPTPTEAEQIHGPPSICETFGGSLDPKAVKSSFPVSQPWPGSSSHSEQGEACVAGDSLASVADNSGAEIVHCATESWDAHTTGFSPQTDQVGASSCTELERELDREAFFNLVPAGPPPPLVFDVKESALPSHQAASKTQTVPMFFLPVLAAAPDVQASSEWQPAESPAGHAGPDAGLCDQALVTVAAYEASKSMAWHENTEPGETDDMATRDLSVPAQDDEPRLDPHPAPASEAWRSERQGSIGLDSKDIQTASNEDVSSPTDGSLLQQLHVEELATDVPVVNSPDACRQNGSVLMDCQPSAVYERTDIVQAEEETDARCSNPLGYIFASPVCDPSIAIPMYMIDPCAVDTECNLPACTELADDQTLTSIGPQGSFHKAAASVNHAYESHNNSEQVPPVSQTTDVLTQLASGLKHGETANLSISFCPFAHTGHSSASSTTRAAADVSSPGMPNKTENLPINLSSDDHESVSQSVLGCRRTSSSPEALPMHSAEAPDCVHMESQGAVQISAAEESGHHTSRRRSFRPPPLVVDSPITTTFLAFSEDHVSLHDPIRVARFAALHAEVGEIGPAPMRASLDMISLKTESDMESCATVASPGCAQNDLEASHKECSEAQADGAGCCLYDMPANCTMPEHLGDLLCNEDTGPQTLSNSMAEQDSKVAVAANSARTIYNPLSNTETRFDDSIAWFDGDMGLEPQFESIVTQEPEAQDVALSTLRTTYAIPSMVSELHNEYEQELCVRYTEDVSAVHGNETARFSDENATPRGCEMVRQAERDEDVTMSINTDLHASGEMAVAGAAEISCACDLERSDALETIYIRVGDGIGEDQSGLDKTHLGRPFESLRARIPDVPVDSKISTSARGNCTQQLQQQSNIKGSPSSADRGDKSKHAKKKKKKKKKKRTRR